MSTNSQPNQFQPHLQLTENVNGRDFIVSDLHGYRSQLDALLNKVQFSFAHDRLISVGDLADRGPESPACLELLQEPWFWAVRGNHEQMLIEAITQETEMLWSRWLMNGGGWSLRHSKDELDEWAHKANNLPLTITLPCHGKTIGICHAEFTAADWQQRYQGDGETVMEWLWGRTRLKHGNNAPIDSVDWVFSGHTIVPDVQILGNSVFIERGAYLGNGLTLIELNQWLVNHQ